MIELKKMSFEDEQKVFEDYYGYKPVCSYCSKVHFGGLKTPKNYYCLDCVMDVMTWFEIPIAETMKKILEGKKGNG